MVVVYVTANLNRVACLYWQAHAWLLRY